MVPAPATKFTVRYLLLCSTPVCHLIQSFCVLLHLHLLLFLLLPLLLPLLSPLCWTSSLGYPPALLFLSHPRSLGKYDIPNTPPYGPKPTQCQVWCATHLRPFPTHPSPVVFHCQYCCSRSCTVPHTISLSTWLLLDCPASISTSSSSSSSSSDPRRPLSGLDGLSLN